VIDYPYSVKFEMHGEVFYIPCTSEQEAKKVLNNYRTRPVQNLQMQTHGVLHGDGLRKEDKK